MGTRFWSTIAQHRQPSITWSALPPPPAADLVTHLAAFFDLAEEKIGWQASKAALVKAFSLSVRLCTSRVCNGNSHDNLGPTGPVMVGCA